MCTRLIRNKTGKLTNKEFDEMTDKMHLFMEENLEFAYSDLDEETLLRGSKALENELRKRITSKDPENRSMGVVKSEKFKLTKAYGKDTTKIHT